MTGVNMLADIGERYLAYIKAAVREYAEDICATAKGYERLANSIHRKKEECR